MEYERGPFSIKSRPVPDDTVDRWSAYPIDSQIHREQKLPCLVSKSQEKINQMVDFVLELPIEERPDGSDAAAWNKLLEERGIIP
jgi:hypothetical protein